jgi:hypothetical protein
LNATGFGFMTGDLCMKLGILHIIQNLKKLFFTPRSVCLAVSLVSRSSSFH